MNWRLDLVRSAPELEAQGSITEFCGQSDAVTVD